jgi:hypothetical protein
VDTEIWFFTDCFHLAALGGYDPGAETGRKSQATANRTEDEWRAVIHPKLMTLIHGHPDPDVRQAADFLDKRIWSAILIIGDPNSLDEPEDDASRKRDEVKHVTIKLIHDGFTKLRRAAYHAPFRVHRPEPTYEGHIIANDEGLPGDILERIKERGEYYEG